MATQAASQGPPTPPRNPLRRSVTSPASPTRAGIQQVHAQQRTQHHPGTRSESLATSPGGAGKTTTVEAMEAAMYRLSSQHHMSEYNRMKRAPAMMSAQVLAGHPFSSAPARQQQPPMPAIPAQRYPGGPAPMLASNNKLARLPNSSVEQERKNQAAQALMGMTGPKSNPLSRPQPPSLEPPPAPKLYRTFTEEEGQNHASMVSPALSGSPMLATPALSMSTSSTTSTCNDGGRRARQDSPGVPKTPPDNGSSGLILSPVQTKTAQDEKNDAELSSKLLDAMDESVLPTSAIPLPANRQKSPFVPSPPRPVVSQQLQGLGVARSITSASVSMSRSGSAASFGNAQRTGSSASLAGYHSSHPGLVGVKTSNTHPMNISPLVPAELLPLYSQNILHSSVNTGRGDTSRSRSPLCKLSTNIDGNGDDTRPPSPSKSRPSSPTKGSSRPASPAKSSSASMMSISRPSTPAVIDLGRPFVLVPSADLHLLTGPNAAAALFNLSLPVAHALAMSSASDGNSTPIVPAKIGNLILSSCPGKKVRLSDSHLSILGVPELCRPGGPPVDPRAMPGAAVAMAAAGNRSPICRDIELDLRRVMQDGDIKVVVCCLDNQELKFLGAAWEEYARVARELGLEVIRLPMAEGFAPASPEQLDAHLTHLITRYTLRGHNALVHCRGGVGRAGLFACSWMIKMGLFGPVVGIHDPAGRHLDKEMDVVERVIEVIRKRRSAKAIETPQQVHFILQYVHWLSTQGRITTAKETLDSLSA